MVVLYATKAPNAFPEAVDDLTQHFTARFENLASLQWVEYAAAVERIQADATQNYIHDELNGFHYRIWPDAFFQENPV